MSHDGFLASKHSINLLTYYCILQCMFISACISSRYGLIVYHVSTSHVDISKMISIKQLWEIFVLSSSQSVQGNRIDLASKFNTSKFQSLPYQARNIDFQLKKYMDSKTPAIYIYTVMLLFSIFVGKNNSSDISIFFDLCRDFSMRMWYSPRTFRFSSKTRYWTHIHFPSELILLILLQLHTRWENFVT